MTVLLWYGVRSSRLESVGPWWWGGQGQRHVTQGDPVLVLALGSDGWTTCGGRACSTVSQVGASYSLINMVAKDEWELGM